MENGRTLGDEINDVLFLGTYMTGDISDFVLDTGWTVKGEWISNRKYIKPHITFRESAYTEVHFLDGKKPPVMRIPVYKLLVKPNPGFVDEEVSKFYCDLMDLVKGKILLTPKINWAEPAVPQTESLPNVSNRPIEITDIILGKDWPSARVRYRDDGSEEPPLLLSDLFGAGVMNESELEQWLKRKSEEKKAVRKRRRMVGGSDVEILNPLQ